MMPSTKSWSRLVTALCFWCAVANTGAFVVHPGYTQKNHRAYRYARSGVTRYKETPTIATSSGSKFKDNFSPINSKGRMNMKSNKQMEGENENKIGNVRRKMLSNASKWQKNMKNWQKNMSACALALLLFVSTMFSFANIASAGGTGGRMGGSFSAPSRSSISTPSRTMRSSYGSSGYSRGLSRGYSYSSPGYYGSTVVAPVYARPFAPVGFFFNGAFFLATAFVLSNIVSGATTSSSDAVSPLGKGVSVVSFSVALNVPGRDDPSSILSYLKRSSDYADTGSRSGLQNLVSQVALELLRQRKSVVAASSQYKHYKNSDEATREFNRWAITQRSKYEKETISKFKGKDYSNPVMRRDDDDSDNSYQATIAVVTIILAIEGGSTEIPVPVNGIGDVADALSKIAADSKVEDCLLGAEILWAPGDISETLSEREIYADYPELRSV